MRKRAISAATSLLLATAATPLVAGSGRARAAPLPQRIMSLNQCNDLMLLMLVPRARIASITFLAHVPVAALMPGADAGVATNHGTAEEVLRDRPDLILGSAWTTPVTRRLAREVGAKVVDIDSANSFEDIRRALRQVADAVGARPRAEALIAGMDRELARLTRTRPARPWRVVAWSGDAVPGRGTLTDAILTAAGAVNVAAAHEDGRYSTFGLEELLAANPDFVLQGVGGYDQPSLREGAARHPLIARRFAGRRIDYPDAAAACGLPQSAWTAARLRRAMQRASGVARR